MPLSSVNSLSARNTPLFKYGIPTPNKLINALSLVIIAFVIYLPVFHHTFLTMWDDQWVVVNRYTTTGITPENLWNVLTEYYHGQYAPINEYLYITLHAIFGYNATAFHIASLLIHCSNIVLVYTLLLRLLRLSNKFQEVSINRIAFFTALLFTIHPFLVEAVSWLSASKNIIYATFYLIALHYYISYLQTQKWKFYLAAILFFIISYGGKEQAVTLPVCLLLMDYSLARKFNRKLWLEKLPFFVLALFFGYISMDSQAANGEGMLVGGRYYPLTQRIPLACYTVSEYLTKCLIPIKLSYLYPFPNQIGEPLETRFWIYPLAAALIIAAFWKVFRPRWMFFGIAFFLIHILLVSNILSLSRFAMVADRYVYLASVGIFFTLAFLFDKWLTEKPAARPFAFLLAGIYVLYLGVYTNQRCKVWHDTDSLKYELRQVIKGRDDYPEIQKQIQMQ